MQVIFEWRKPSEAFTDIITEALPVDVVCISIWLLCSSTSLRVISNDEVVRQQALGISILRKTLPLSLMLTQVTSRRKICS